MVIDLFGLEKKEVRSRFPAVYQHLKENVKPEREQNRTERLRKEWWLHRRSREEIRDAIAGLSRYIVTPETAKHRFFQFLDIEILPDNMVTAFALEDAFHLGVLSSRIHVLWSLAAGGRMGVGNDPRYTKTQCFDPFPFPAANASQKAAIRDLGAQLDAHRKERLGEHDDLTMTALYNLLKKERRGEDLDESEREIHEQGLVGVLRELHDELDAVVADAYGWNAGQPEETILQRLVALNAERRAEEEEGHVRYLRPAYQAPETVETQAELELDIQVGGDGAPAEPLDWPSGLTPRAKAIRAVMTHAEEPLTVEQVAQHFHRARRADVRELLETLAALGHMRATNDGAHATDAPQHDQNCRLPRGERAVGVLHKIRLIPPGPVAVSALPVRAQCYGRREAPRRRQLRDDLPDRQRARWQEHDPRARRSKGAPDEGVRGPEASKRGRDGGLQPPTEGAYALDRADVKEEVETSGSQEKRKGDEEGRSSEPELRPGPVDTLGGRVVDDSEQIAADLDGHYNGASSRRRLLEVALRQVFADLRTHQREAVTIRRLDALLLEREGTPSPAGVSPVEHLLLGDAHLQIICGPPVDIPPPERVSLDVKMQRLNIEWADGHASVFPLDGLREACPCAECEGQKVERIPKPGFLHIFRQKNRWKNVQIEKAGSVGLRITWDDGHRGGIYRWDRLRELQPPAE